MNHQPFRDWLVSKEELSIDQSQELQAHLDGCEACQGIDTAWMELETVLQKSPQVGPAFGFTERWEQNLAFYLARRQKQEGIVVVGLISLIITSLSILLITQFWSVLQSPGPYIAAWFSRYLDIFTILLRLQDFINPLNWNIPVYAFISLFFMVGLGSFMSVLWLATYRKLSLERRRI